MHEGRANLSRISRMAIPAAVLALGLLVSPLATAARAEISPCYSDPVVVLSNGVTLDLSATIWDLDSDVSQVAYALNIPAGAQVVSVTTTSGPLGPKETFRVSASNAPNTYSSSTIVYTGTGPIDVTASTSAAGPTGTVTQSVTGYSNQRLRMTVSP